MQDLLHTTESDGEQEECFLSHMIPGVDMVNFGASSHMTQMRE